MRHHLPFARRLGAATFLMAAAGCLKGTEPIVTDPGTPSNPATETYAASLGVNIAQMTKLSDNLYIQDVAAGGGTQATGGRLLGVTYTGWLVNGTQFDSNVGKAAFSFPLGIGAVIPGWDQGLVGMHAGGTRRLVIGSALGYGGTGSGPIPPNATLVFVVQLTSVQ
jgi:FKBP-type peptidyl-prolyl cis-trans isomerase FkpA